jgi:hypothetical protein
MRNRQQSRSRHAGIYPHLYPPIVRPSILLWDLARIFALLSAAAFLLVDMLECKDVLNQIV